MCMNMYIWVLTSGFWHVIIYNELVFALTENKRRCYMRQKNDNRKMEVYHFMTNHMKEHGVYPTVQEIGNRLGMAKSIVSKYRNRLIDDGLIEKLGRYQIKTADNLSCSRRHRRIPSN